MRRGHATRPAMRPPPPPRLMLLLVLLLASSCPGDASTPSTGTTPSGSVAAAAATTVKPSIAPSGIPASSTLKPTTSKTLLATTASMTTAKSVPAATTKETLKTTLVASTRAPAASAPSSINPLSASVSSKTTGVMSVTTASKPPAAPPTSSPTGPKGASPSVLPSSDSSSKGTTTTRPPLSSPSKSTLSPIVAKVPTSPGATASHRPTTAPGHGSSVVPPGSAATTKEKTTGPTTVSVVTTTAKPGPLSPKGSVPTTTATKHEGKKDSATTLVPLGAPPPTPDSTHTAAATTRAPTLSPEHHSPPPASGTIQAPFQAQTKVVCEKAIPSEYPGIILTFNDSTPCSSLEGSPLKEPLLHELCRAVKSNFNKSRDDCTGSFASVSDDPKKLAVLRVSVTTHSVDDELSESLVLGELEKLGLTNLTYAGKPLDNGDDPFSLPLIITIVCMAASLLLVAAIYGCCHQRISRRKDQRLTEELQTMENGYHDNPTLEVMETSAEMQEKKVNLNGELADSWIVPMDSLMKEDLEEEEDTHL
ncbi:podocalyxin isoform X2 [Anolis carolinensis]|uniref:podocalyxin isoform X2 n=1 Tax=Anolis carolinensis TaxID=28377 RepID=UPI002F2B89F0